MRKNILVALDFGSSKLAVAVGEVNPDRSVNVLALNQAASAGLRKGNVIDIESAAKVLDAVLEEVEKTTGIRIHSLSAGFEGVSAATASNRASVAVSNPRQGVTAEDVRKSIQASRMLPAFDELSVIHAIPRFFTIDGHKGVVDPLGMIGSRLEVEVTLVTAKTSALQNLARTIAKTGTRVKSISLNILMTAEAVLLPAEKEMGVALIDIGGGTSEIAVFEQGLLIFASVIPVGGDFITRDLAVGLRTDLEEAQRIKEGIGYVSGAFISDEETLEIASLDGKDNRKVSVKFAASIIEARIEEIMEMVDMELRRAGYNGILPAGAVLTGGTSLLKGIAVVGEEYLKMPIRIGYPESFGSGIGGQCGPEYSAVLGNIIYAARSSGGSDGTGKQRLLGGLFSRFGSWLKDFFN